MQQLDEKLCSVELCERPIEARGWCGTHYARWRRTGGVEDDVPIQRKGRGNSRAEVMEDQGGITLIHWDSRRCDYSGQQWTLVGDISGVNFRCGRCDADLRIVRHLVLER